ADVRGTWTMEVAKPGPEKQTEKKTISLELGGSPTKLSGKLVHGDKSTKLISPELSHLQFGTSFKAEPLAAEGIVQLSLTIAPGKGEAAPTAVGTLVWADGQMTDVTAERTAGPKSEEEVKAAEKADGEKKEDAKAEGDKQDSEQKDDEKKDEEKSDKAKDLGPAISPVNFPLGAYGRAKGPEQPPVVVFRGATVWTCGPAGKLEAADVLVEA